MVTLDALRSKLDTYFFSSYRYHNLGLLRAGLSLVILYHYGGSAMRRFMLVGAVPGLHHPPSLLEWLHLPYPLPENAMALFPYTFWIVGLLSVAGLATRPAVALLGVHLLYMMGTQASMGWFDHEAAVSTQVLFVLAIVPGTTNFSLDRLGYWFFKKKGTFQDALLGPPASMWGVRLLLILMCLVYLTSGISKMRFSEGRWFDGSTLAFYLEGSASIYKTQDIQRFFGSSEISEEKLWKDGFGIEAHHYMNAQNNPERMAVAKWIADTTWLVSLLSVLTLLLELSSPLILFDGWPRTLYLISAIIMHTSIGYLMNINFKEFQIIDFLLIDWYLILFGIYVYSERKWKWAHP